MRADRSRWDSPPAPEPFVGFGAFEQRSSPSWDDGPPPEVAVQIPTYGRAAFLPALLERLEAQVLTPARFEVVIVDNGSRDETWSVLCELVVRSPLRLRVVRLPDNDGPAAARNVAVSASRAPLLAFTDDDCLPTPRWLAAILAAAAEAEIVQGRTEPDPSHVGPGAWDRTIRIADESPLFETCNIAYRRTAFAAAGGFDQRNTVAARPGGRAFGEDVLLGDAVVARGGRRSFAPDAIVHHRYLPGTFADHVREMRNLVGFAALAAETDVVSDALWNRVFLTRRTASFDLAALAAVAALVSRRPSLLTACVPWVVQTMPLTRAHGGRHAAVRLVQLAVADAVGAASLLEGSIRHRRLVL